MIKAGWIESRQAGACSYPGLLDSVEVIVVLECVYECIYGMEFGNKSIMYESVGQSRHKISEKHTLC